MLSVLVRVRNSRLVFLRGGLQSGEGFQSRVHFFLALRWQVHLIAAAPCKQLILNLLMVLSEARVSRELCVH